MSTAKVKQAPAARTASKAPAAAPAKAPAAKAAEVAPAAKAAEAAPAPKAVEAAPATQAPEVAPVPQAAEIAPAAQAVEVAPAANVADAPVADAVNVSAAAAHPAAAAAAQARAVRTYEDSIRTTKESVDEAMKSGATLARGLQDIGKAFLGLTQASIEDSVSASKKIMAAKTLHEAFELQSELTKSNLNRMLAEGSRLTEMTAGLYRDALAPITARVTASVEKMVKAGN